MAVTDQSTLVTYAAAGVATDFGFPGRIIEDADLVVQLDGITLDLDADYTVISAGEDGGAIHFAAAPVGTLRLFRAVSPIRSTDYQTSGDFLADVVNADFDRIVMMVQDMRAGAAAILNSLRAPPGEVLLELPNAADRANSLLGFDSDGDPVGIIPVDGSAASVVLDLANTATAAKGAGMVGYSAAIAYAAGSVGKTLADFWTVLGEVVSPSRFGALGDGLTDDVVPLQATLDYLNALGGGTMLIPPGDFLISAPLVHYSHIRMIGASRSATKITKNTSNVVAASASAGLVCLDLLAMGDGAGDVNCVIWSFDAIRVVDAEIAHMTIRSSGNAATTAPVRFGLATVGMSDSHIHDLDFEFFSSASFVSPDFFFGQINGIKSHRCGQGVSIEAGTSFGYSSNYSIYCQRYGHYLRDCSYISVKNNACDGLNNLANATDYTDRTVDSRCYVLNACNGVEFANNGAEDCFGSFVYVDSCVATTVRNNCAFGPHSSYSGANHVALFYVNILAHGVKIEDNFVIRDGTVALQGAANAANHHDLYVDVAFENQGFKYLNNWTGNTKYDPPSAIYGNIVPSYVSGLQQGAQIQGDFVPVLTLPGATGVTVAPAGDNKARYSIVNGWMDVEVELIMGSVTFTGTGTLTIAGLPFVNGSAKSARLLVQHSSGFGWASTESYFLDIAPGASVGTLKNRSDTVSGVTTSVLTSGAAAYLLIKGKVYVGDVVNVR